MDESMQEALSSLMNHIRKEIKTGKVESHVSIEQKGDTFSIITNLKGKRPTKKSWEIPQEDRDEHMSLLQSLSKLQQNDPFFKLMEAIRGSRRIYHSDEIWKKNILHFMGEGYNLDRLVDLRQNAEPLLEDIQIKKTIQNSMVEKVEKNVILQSLYQALVLKEYRDTKDIKTYRVLNELLSPKKIIHQVKRSDGSTVYVADGEPIEGIVEKSYTSLKQYDVNRLEQKDEKVVGVVVNWARYRDALKEMGLSISVLSSQIMNPVTHFVMVNEPSRAAVGMGRYEGYVDGSKPLGGNTIRRALSYGQDSTMPAVWNGALYRSRIAAIMAPSIDGLAIGEENEAMSEIELWNAYTEMVADRSKKGGLLKHERDVLQQNWSVQENQWKSLLATWRTEGIRPAALHIYGKKVYSSYGGLWKILMEKLDSKSLAHIATAKDAINHTLLLRWILTNKKWNTQKHTDKNAKHLRMMIETEYGIRLNRATLDDLEEFVEMWIESEPVKWDSPSLEQSIQDSGFESPQVTADELVTFVREYGDAAWKRLRSSVDLAERYGLGVVLGVFISILHPSLRDHTETEIRLVSGRDLTKEIGSIIVTKELRNVIRSVMTSFGIVYFELPVDEVQDDFGASERKETREVDDAELERIDGRRSMTIAIDTGMSMRLI